MKRFTEMFQRMLIAEPITMKILLHDDVDSGLATLGLTGFCKPLLSQTPAISTTDNDGLQPV
ncbi:hypothetical protein [Antrihabitans spumae]|uniref:Uncharacterized protein n=1 Tax=Antrihabitans spumae TaxID=3373370 RepID=A0ABW7KTY7_9NOCA